MTPQAALVELLDRLETRQGAAVHITESELNDWPTEAVRALKAARLLVKARPASSVVCPGCERECTKPVEIYPAADGRPARAFIHCDEPEDLGRIKVEPSAVEQWRVTGETLAVAIARLLDFTKSPQQDGAARRWTLGLLKGKAQKGTIKLACDGEIAISAGGRTMALAEILSLGAGGLVVDKDKLLRLVDKPAPGAQAYKPSIARREARKLNTQSMYKSWQKAYRELKKHRRNMSDVWYAQQIAKTDIAIGRSADTIRKRMRE